MRDGFVRVACGAPKITVADPRANARQIAMLMGQAAEAGAKLLVLPELCLTGATCGDLFFQKTLQVAAMDALRGLMKLSEDTDLITILGLPVTRAGRIYNCAAALQGGELLGLCPKRNLDAAERRWFSEGCASELDFGDGYAPMDPDLLLSCENMPELSISMMFGGGLYRPREVNPATVVACLSAMPELVGRDLVMEMLVQAHSLMSNCALVLSSAGAGESSTDFSFSGRQLVAENGKLLAKNAPYAEGLIMTELDVSFLCAERARQGHPADDSEEGVPFSISLDAVALIRVFEPLPFVPGDPLKRAERCEQILNIQSQGLVQRMRTIGCQKLVLGVSGGLDSTLAMLVCARALKALNLPNENLISITMPCFGTTMRTKGNARKLTEALKGDFREIDISQAVTQHFADIGHDSSVCDVTYENAQARERTQVLMDIANQTGGIVIGTGDMSELMLGWATFNGDHMAMYAVNAGVPKTLVRHLTRYAADTTDNPALRAVLRDILDTPVSPELLPPKDGEINQKTEEIVGPYELHDFFIYHLVRRMDTPAKIKRLALQSFAGIFDEATIDKWLRVFLKRFVQQQFKRSCLCDSPKIGSVGVSPRGDLVMPSDAGSALFLEAL